MTLPLALRARSLALLPLLALAGCPLDDPDDDDTPLRFLTMEPATSPVPVTTSFRAIFSEEVNEITVSADLASEELLTVLLIEQTALTAGDDGRDGVNSDMDNPPLAESRLEISAEIDVALVDGGSTLEVVPRANLRPGTGYYLVLSGNLRDTAGNPLVGADGNKTSFFYGFLTDAGAPVVTGSDAGGVVVPNRKRITVTFNQPVQNVTSDTLTIEADGGGAQAPVVESLLMNTTRTEATLTLGVLPGNDCERLSPGGSYAVVAGAGIVADTTQTLEPYREEFTVSGACDVTPNVASALEVVAADVIASVRFTTTKPSTTEVRYGLQGSAVLDCLGAVPCPVVGAPTTTANAVHSVALEGLAVNVDYDIVVLAEDAVGNVARADGTFRTAALPKIAVNEALANAEGASDPAGIFVELLSFEASTPHDLTGWSIRTTKVDPAAANRVSTCDLPSPAPTLAAGDFLVLADDAFNSTALYANVDEPAVLRFAGFCSLVDEPLIIELVDPAGRPVSSLTMPSAREGVSVERRDAAGADDAENVCFARDETGPTPTRANGVTALGCE